MANLTAIQSIAVRECLRKRAISRGCTRDPGLALAMLKQEDDFPSGWYIKCRVSGAGLFHKRPHGSSQLYTWCDKPRSCDTQPRCRASLIALESRGDRDNDSPGTARLDSDNNETPGSGSWD